MIRQTRKFFVASLGAVLTVGAFSTFSFAESPRSDVAVSLESPFAEIAALEQDENLSEALRVAEAFYETAPEDDATRLKLREIFARLRPKVERNDAPEKAGVWRVRAFAIRGLDFERIDADGKVLSTKCAYDDAEIERIRRCVSGFADFVWKFSDGALRIDWRFDVVDGPIRTLDEIDGRYWPGPDSTFSILPEIETNSTDTIVVFVKTADGDADDARIPLLLFGGALGEYGDWTRGATYIGFNWETGAAANEPDGEPLLHEWLHSLQWALEERQRYPRGLAGNPDGGRFVGENRDPDQADPCYRRDPEKEKSWLGLYFHILQTHATRKMLREASERAVKFER